jgi:hypothetical protein
MVGWCQPLPIPPNSLQKNVGMGSRLVGFFGMEPSQKETLASCRLAKQNCLLCHEMNLLLKTSCTIDPHLAIREPSSQQYWAVCIVESRPRLLPSCTQRHSKPKALQFGCSGLLRILSLTSVMREAWVVESAQVDCKKNSSMVVKGLR